jgi:2-oxoglutarate dehydrogenase E1 component
MRPPFSHPSTNRMVTHEMEPSSQPNTLSLPFAEDLLASYQSDPESVPADWRRYLAALLHEPGTNGANGASTPAPAPRYALGPSFPQGGVFSGNGFANGYSAIGAFPALAEPKPGPTLTEKTVNDQIAMVIRQDWLDQLVRAYRCVGHYAAQIDPLDRPRPPVPDLDPKMYGFSDDDTDLVFSVDTLAGPGSPQTMPFRDVVQKLRNTYCRSIGVEYMHIDDLKIRRWLQERMEHTENRLELSRTEQIRILKRLTDAVVFEDFLAKRFQGKKTFSLKGAESLIPLLDLAIERAGELGAEQIMVAMAHRGRLNVLANVIGKDPKWIFRELDDPESDRELYRGRGDVKYHLGYSRDVTTSSGRTVHLSLCFNPSHLEYVNPVALGRVRAMQDRIGDSNGEKEVAILIHGDASFIGEGVIQETFNMSRLPAYSVQGAIHVIVNNQIGFTTGEQQARSTTYTTDIAKMLPIPVFHVNGEDPEAVAQVVRLALDFRREFKRDVVIDMLCYRYYGHNESDEPAFTQPLMYKRIRSRKPVLDSYLDHLVKLGGISADEAAKLTQERQEALDKKMSESREPGFRHADKRMTHMWKTFLGGADKDAPESPTAVPKDRSVRLLEMLTRLPEGFTPHKTIDRMLENRRRMARGEMRLDWGTAESLAFASLATEPMSPSRIRLTGQDCERGTFSHRHAVLHDSNTGSSFMPLAHLAPEQAPVEIYNSPLAEAAVVGFEWGYSLKTPDALVLWEAQFGDFCNVAQVIIDQFISSAEDKWGLLSGLVLLLPHGFEGQGPEHSSARLERFLALAAEDNMQIVNLTTPAQYFHCLRRQVLRPWRKPLVVMTPKSLLRDELSTSTLEELADGSFQRVIPDAAVDPKAVSRILLCSGKVYFDLLRHREATKRTDVAIVRMEQLYPLSMPALEAVLAPFKDGTPVCWVQEEPKNMGAWYFLNVQLGTRLLGRFPIKGVYRPESASPATGSYTSHKQEQSELIHEAFEG